MLSASKGTRNQAGLINEVDVTRARTELANVEANLYATERQRAQVEHALAVLCGQPPASFAVAASPSIIAPPIVPAWSAVFITGTSSGHR
jgi:outer membrane protein TolC